MDNNIWFSNINLLFSKDNLFKIVPSSNMIMGEKINTITRFALYLSILLYLTSALVALSKGSSFSITFPDQSTLSAMINPPGVILSIRRSK